jgi:hypothetical protein
MLSLNMAKSKLNPDHTTEFKICTKCRKKFKRTLDNFEVRIKCRDGLNSWCRSCSNAARRNVSHRYVLKQKGVTLEQYQRMVETQNGICAVCSSPPSRTKLNVDHCHDTGKVRGLLCWNCNMAIGYMKNSPALLRAAADYLEAAA